MIEVKPTDKKFKFSPDAGHPDCICSRCSRQITEDEAPILRIHDSSENAEYRYCNDCAETMGVMKIDGVPFYGVDEDERACRQCGCTQNKACFHPKYGPCWWVEDDLCSHCQMKNTGAI